MPAIDSGPVEGVYEVKFGGDATLERVLVLLREFDERARESPGLRAILDESDLRVSQLRAGDVRRIIDAFRLARHIRSARVAIVAPTPVVYGLNRMAMAFADADDVFCVFRAREEAEAWLA